MGAGAAKQGTLDAASSLPKSSSSAGSKVSGKTATQKTLEAGSGIASYNDFSGLPLAITINNGLSGLMEEAIPELASPDDYYFDSVMFLDDEKSGCFVATVGISPIHLYAPVTSGSISGFFGNNGKVFTDIDLDVSFDARFFWNIEVADGFNICDVVGFIDNAADFLVQFFSGNSNGQNGDDISFEELTLTASGLEAETDFTLGLVGDTLQIQSIEKLTAEIGHLSYDGTALATYLAVLAEGVINLEVGDLTDTVNLVINELLLPSQEDRLVDFVNTAIAQNLTVEESVALGDFSATIEVTPSALKSSRSENNMTLEFAFDIASDKATDPCAEGLSFIGDRFGTALSTSSDFDIKLPHSALAKIFYEAGRQGLFCQSTLMPFSIVPWTVRPEGALSVENARWTETVTGSNGFQFSVVHHGGELVLTVPMVFEGDAFIYSGLATGDLKVYFKPIIKQRLVYVSVTEIDIENVSGTLTLPGGGTVNMTAIVDTVLSSAANILAARLGAIPLIPKTTAFDDDLGIELNVVSINDAYTTVGANIVELPEKQVATQSNGPLRYPDENDLPDLNNDIRDRLNPLP